MSSVYHGAIDCDIHPSVPNTTVLIPYLDVYWREMRVLRELARIDSMSYPPNLPLSGRPDWRRKEDLPGTDLNLLKEQALDHFGLRYAICNCLCGAQAFYDGNMAAAFCRATNDWIRKEWLEHDPRLRASIILPLQNPDLAAEEIERLAGDKRFVQVLLPSRCELSLGRKFYWPIYRAAERHSLPIGIHAGSMFRHAPTQSGFPSTFVEDYAAQTQAFGAQLASFIAEGVFAKFPELRVVLIESGVTWLPAMIWRLAKDWRGIRVEVPWVKSEPGAIIRDHVRLTVQPFDGPSNPDDLERILEHLGSDDLLLFATDYPHWQFEGDAALPSSFSKSILRKILVENPLATYPRLKETIQ